MTITLAGAEMVLSPWRELMFIISSKQQAAQQSTS